MPRNGSKSAGSGRSRSGVRAGQTIIDTFEIDSAKRRAKIIGCLAGFFAGLVTGAITSTFQDDATAFFWAVIVAFAVGFVAAGVVLIWPGLRMAWHWAGELILLALVVTVWALFNAWAGPLVALGATLLVIGVPWLIRPVNRFLVRWAWCMIVRHRIRVACDAFIEGKGVRGSVMPLILWARPTDSGERVWLWLRGDLTLDDLRDRLTELASVCWAQDASAEMAGSKAAYVVVDIRRRDVLAEGVAMPVTEMLEGIDPDSYPVEYRRVDDAEGVDLTPESVDAELDALLGTNRGRKPRQRKADDVQTATTATNENPDEGDLPAWV
jgi:hypothetical protein